jgi:hypothetical protein
VKATAQSLTYKIKDKPTRTFIGNWEMLEELITSIYHSGEITPTDRELFVSLQYALRSLYAKCAATLRPYWQQIKVAGKTNQNDPFLTMLDVSVRSSQVDYWDMVQTLPVAREALNKMVLDTSNGE